MPVAIFVIAHAVCWPEAIVMLLAATAGDQAGSPNAKILV